MRCGYEILTKVGTIPILSNSNNQIQIDTKNNTLDEGWRCYDWATRLENLYIRLFRVPLLVVFFFVVFLAEPLSVYLNSILWRKTLIRSLREKWTVFRTTRLRLHGKPILSGRVCAHATTHSLVQSLGFGYVIPRRRTFQVVQDR